MEFTKTEQKILSLRYDKWDKLLLWTGILALCVSLGLILYENHLNDRLRQKFEKTEFNLTKKIEPSTERETQLKSMLLIVLAGQTEYRLKYFEVRYSLLPVVLFFVGINFVGVYFMKRRFIRLIRKLQKSAVPPSG